MPDQTPPPGVMPDHRAGEGCVCGHGAYNHGGGRTALGRMMGEHSRCIRCSCMEFRREATDA